MVALRKSKASYKAYLLFIGKLVNETFAEIEKAKRAKKKKPTDKVGLLNSRIKMLNMAFINKKGLNKQYNRLMEVYESKKMQYNLS